MMQLSAPPVKTAVGCVCLDRIPADLRTRVARLPQLLARHGQEYCRFLSGTNVRLPSFTPVAALDQPIAQRKAARSGLPNLKVSTEVTAIAMRSCGADVAAKPRPANREPTPPRS